MNYCRVGPAAAMILVFIASAAAAQTDRPSAPPDAPATLPSVDISGDRLVTLERWVKEYDDWKAWFDRWENRRESGWFSPPKRRQPPTPPEWLPDACALLGDEKGTIGDGCRAFRDWLQADVVTEVVAQKIAQTRASQESPRKSIWWEHIHVDALWPMTQAGSSVYGVAGMHTTLQVSRRFQVFLAPGVMMVRLPSSDGGQEWTPATHWGFSYRLIDFVLPGTHRPSSLHVNIARVWLLGQSGLPAAREMYLAGFSLTFRNRGDEPDPDHTGDPASSSAQHGFRSGTR